MRYLLTTVLLFFTLLCLSQRILSFNVYQSKGIVTGRFSISPGPPCLGYSVLHSIDSLTYTQIYEDPTQCGEFHTSVEKSFTHSTPAQNQLNFYKVQLSPYEMSEVRRIYVSATGQSGLLSFPNPVYQNIETLSLKFLSPPSGRVIGYLYNQAGKPLREYDMFVKEEQSSIPVGNLANGMYVLWFTDGTQAFSCKIIVYR